LDKLGSGGSACSRDGARGHFHPQAPMKKGWLDANPCCIWLPESGKDGHWIEVFFDALNG
jgi:hypothetical protein